MHTLLADFPRNYGGHGTRGRGGGVRGGCEHSDKFIYKIDYIHKQFPFFFWPKCTSEEAIVIVRDDTTRPSHA